MNKKEWFQKNKVFVLIAAAVILAAFISIFSEYIGENPFRKNLTLENPVKLYTSNDVNYCISDSSDTILILDDQYRLKNSIHSGEEDDTFFHAESLTWDDNGDIFVHDKELTENGSFSVRERILQFSSDGKFKSVLYETETLDENDRQFACLDGLKVIDNAACFSEVTENEINIYKITNGKAELIKSYPLQKAFMTVADTAVNNDLETAIALKNGDVLYASGNTFQKIYDARKHDAKEYNSLISELTFDEEDQLYLCDVGLREIYSIDTETGKTETVISRNSVSSFHLDIFSKMPLYTGINVNNGSISFLSEEYTYDIAADEEIYTYRIVSVSKNGELKFYSENIGIATSVRIKIICIYIAILLFAAIFIYSAHRIIYLFKESKPEKGIALQLIMLATALSVTVCVSYVIFDNCNNRYEKESGKNLTNISYRVGKEITASDMENISSPDFSLSDEYQQLDEKVNSIIHDKNNAENNLYCVIYKIKNDVVYEAYRDDGIHGSMYPMAGSFSGSIEEYISKENEFDVAYEFELSEGTYIYSIVPVYDESGNNIAFVESGMDYSRFSAETKALYIKVLIIAAMAVIIIMLLFSEFLCGFQAIREKRISRKKHLICPPEVIRPLSFVFFFIANLSTAFLPIYGTKLWNENFPMQAEMAAALPLSAEFIMSAVAAFACGFLIQKTGIRFMCAVGGGCYVAGGLISAFAGNLWILIFANAMCGIGSGLLSIALNTWAASYEEEENQNKGFIHINGAYLAGLNCGTVIGSILWEIVGIKMTFLLSTAGAGLLIFLVLCLVGKINIISEEAEERKGKLRDLWNMSVIRYFLFISVPYLTCTAFLEYFFPIQAERNGLSAMQISMAFLISGMVSIYIGASFAESITAKLGTKKAMILASFLYVSALSYLVINPSIWNCYIVAAVFAVADSFGLSAQSVYFSSLPAVKKAGQSKSLGVNNTVESITQSCGSLIFGAALMLGTQKGILVIASVFAILLLGFVVFERQHCE